MPLTLKIQTSQGPHELPFDPASETFTGRYQEIFKNGFRPLGPNGVDPLPNSIIAPGAVLRIDLVGEVDG